MDASTLGLALGLGFVLGLEHALDADHIVAVAALSSRADGRHHAMKLGIAWGSGHTLTLAAAGGILLGLQLSLPPRLAWFFEFCVGIMLIALGASVCRRAILEWRHRHEHVHGEVVHTHAHRHRRGEAHAHDHASLRRPFAIGIVHGLAGSAALMLLVLSTLDSALGGLLYILAFGAGSVGAMAIVSSLLGLSFSALSSRAAIARWRIGTVAGSLSIIMGAILIASLVA